MGASAFVLTDATAYTLGRIVFQARNSAAFDYSSVQLQYDNGEGAQFLSTTRTELDNTSGGIASRWEWDVSALGIKSYNILFNAAAIHSSLDAVSLDTQATIFQPQPFQTNFAMPSLDRWMYAHNASLGDRASASTFGSTSTTSDSRNAQFLVGFSTSNSIPTGLALTNYLIRSVRLVATIDRGDAFAYDPTHDIFNSYQPTDALDYVADSDAGRPIELFGAGFRDGYTAATFLENSTYGSSTVEGRNAYAASYDANGLWVDVSNNSGKSNSFEAIPFAVGTNNSLVAGELVPVDTSFYFDLNLNDPMVLSYAQNALREGMFDLVVSSLHSAAQGGSPTYPSFYNKENLFGGAPAQFEIVGTVVRPLDSDGDGMPDDWEHFYFGNLNGTATQDSDLDGQNNLAEYLAGTDPTQAGSAFKVTSTQRTQNGNCVVEFNVASSQNYEIQYSDDLTTWSAVTNPTLRINSPGKAQWTDDGSQTGSLSVRRFYRVHIK